MITILLILLFAFDLIILTLVLGQRRRIHLGDGDVLREMTEERERIREFADQIREDLDRSEAKSKDLLNQVKRVAAEIEHEVKGGSSKLVQELEVASADISTKLSEPIEQLTRKQLAIEALLRKCEQNRSSLQKQMARAEKLCKFFDNRVSYEEILDEIEDKKYSDARQLLAKGIKAEEVARDLGLSLSEIKLISSLSNL